MAQAVLALRCTTCLIDGEVVVCGNDGVAVFQRLRTGSQRKPEAMLYAFDLIQLQGDDLRSRGMALIGIATALSGPITPWSKNLGAAGSCAFASSK